MPSVDHKINDSYYQSNAASCWYAAYCMLYDWKGKPTSAIREKIEASKLGAAGYADAWRNGLREEDYPTVRAALGLWGFRRMYFSSLADDLDYFGKTLKDYGPFWCALHSDSSNSDHGVVVCGVNVDAKTIHVMNPWGSTGTAESQYYTAGSAARTWRPRRRCFRSALGVLWSDRGGRGWQASVSYISR